MVRYLLILNLCAVLSASVAEHAWSTAVAAQFEKFNSGDVAFDYPDNWRLIALPAPVVAGITRGNELSFTISRTSVEYPQAFNEAFAQYETETIRKQYPDATDFTSGTVKHKTLGEILQVDLIRPKGGQPGRGGRPLRLRLYSIPAGRSVYRVICLSRADEFARRHEPVFNRMLETLVITPPASGNPVTVP